MRIRQIAGENGRYRIGSPLLLLFSTPFIVWQMGVLFFSGTTLSLFGRTPIPLTQGSGLVIAAGYAASIFALSLFAHKAVWMERVLLPAALAAAVLMLFPFPPVIVTALFGVQAFCCVFSIGVMLSIAARHFTLDTTWRDSVLSMTVGGVLIAVIQNDLFKVRFTAFALLSVLLIALQCVFYFLLPARMEAARPVRGKAPGLLFLGLWFIITVSTLLICLASSFAQSVPHGVSVLYLSAAAMAVALHWIRRRLGARAIRAYGAFFALAAFGFVLAYLSLQLPGLRLAACAFLGLIVVLANLWMYFAAVSYTVFPLASIGALGAGTGVVTALLHASLLALLRENTSLLYGIYAALSVALLLVYFFMEPYFLRAWNKARAEQRAEAALPAGAPDASAGTSLPNDPLAALSEQERTLANLILDGHTETSAANAMHITLNTQKSYRKNLYAKLDVHTKRELFALVNAANPQPR